mgnify:CR=1 FL=1
MPTIAIIGASQDRSKFGNKAVRVFADKGFKRAMDKYTEERYVKEVEALYLELLKNKGIK